MQLLSQEEETVELIWDKEREYHLSVPALDSSSFPGVRYLYARLDKESSSFRVEMWASGPWLEYCRCPLRSAMLSSSDWGYSPFKKQCGRKELQLVFAHAVSRDPDTHSSVDLQSGSQLKVQSPEAKCALYKNSHKTGKKAL